MNKQQQQPQRPAQQTYQPATIVRQHSYLNAMKTNDQFPSVTRKSDNHLIYKSNQLYRQIESQQNSFNNSFPNNIEAHDTIQNIDSNSGMP